MDEIDFHLDLLVDRWLPLPPPEVDVDVWAKDAARELSGIDGQPAAEPGLTEQLLLWAGDPQRGDYEMAAVLVPEAKVGVYAWLTAMRLADAGDIAKVEEVARDHEPVGTGEVTRVDLPIGPAVRTRGVVSSPGANGTGELVERVRWFVLPPQLEGQAVELTMCWAASAGHEADDLAELADDIAATLTVDLRRP